MAEPTFLKLRPKYILVVQYGDPNSNEALKTSFGIFDSREEADDFRETVYTETNHTVSYTHLALPTILLV